MKNKILIGIGTFVAILAVIGLVAISFTMTPAVATNQSNVSEFINITCTTAIQLNDSSINGGVGSVLQGCIDRYSDRSVAVVDTLNGSTCWSGQSTYDFIRLLNKGNNWLVITLNLTNDGGFIGQTGGQQFGWINNSVYLRVRSGSQTNASLTGSNDNDTGCYNATAYNTTLLQVGVPVTLCGALGWDIYKNEIDLFKEWWIQPKTAPGGYNFTETITATQERCGGPDPVKTGYGQNFSGMYLPTGTDKQITALSPSTLAFGNPITAQSTVLTTKVNTIAMIRTPNSNFNNAQALFTDANFGKTGGHWNVSYAGALGNPGTAVVSGLTLEALANSGIQLAVSNNAARVFLLGTDTGAAQILQGHARECPVTAPNVIPCAGADDINFKGLTGLTTWTLWAGLVDEGSFDPTAAAADTDNNAIYFILVGAVSAGQPYQVAVAKWDTTGANSLSIVSVPVNTPYIAGATMSIVGIGFDPDGNLLYMYNNAAATQGILAAQVSRSGDSILSVSPSFNFVNTVVFGATPAGGVTVMPTGIHPGMVFNN